MTDRELLKLAAKAEGTISEQWDGSLVTPLPNMRIWNPLTDDGDALRLAVKLGIQITPGTYLTQSATAYCPGSQAAEEHVHYQQDMLAATRRAIVRAAAEIGKGANVNQDA